MRLYFNTQYREREKEKRGETRENIGGEKMGKI